VLAYALRRLRDRSAAEDAAAETFLIAWRRLDDIPGDPLPWLLGIARHVIHNELRSVRRRGRLAARVGAQPERAPADHPGDTSPITEWVLRALDRLGERDREVLLLTTWDGLDHRRAAAVLGCSRGTFAVRLHRARARLARELSATDTTPTDRETT
jgi:RNA polymerase sigma-70 factor (ECF subfamily)